LQRVVKRKLGSLLQGVGKETQIQPRGGNEKEKGELVG